MSRVIKQWTGHFHQDELDGEVLREGEIVYVTTSAFGEKKGIVDIELIRWNPGDYFIAYAEVVTGGLTIFIPLNQEGVEASRSI